MTPAPSAANFGETIRAESPIRAVKKMRGGMGESVVRDWDLRGSPGNRRIVTRSSREEDLIELREEDDLEGDVMGDGGQEVMREEILRVEIENEDGTVLELDAEEGEAEVEDDDWDDESMTEEAVWDATLMHLAETIGEPEVAQQEAGEQQQVGEEDLRDDMVTETDDMAVGAITAQQDTNPTESPIPEVLSQDHESPAKQPEHAPPIPHLKPALKQTSQFAAIPEGFVSPVKERQRRTINQVRLSNANRRRTLPVNFAAQHPAPLPTPLQEEIVQEDSDPEPVEEAEPSSMHLSRHSPPELVEEAGDVLVMPSESVSEEIFQAALDDDDSDVELGVISNDVEAAQEPQVDDAHDENAWEDVDEEDHDESADVEMEEEMTQRPEMDLTPEDETMSEPLPSCEEQQVDETVSEDAALRSPTKQDSSPVGSITGPHPRLPLRRSPRRQSTSPVRKSNILPPPSRSHLIAFTPVKLPVYTSPLQDSPLPATSTMDFDTSTNNPTPLPQPLRSSSAPPEEPQMSPRRPKQPRISDDTALLQAFLNRAAESKTSKDSTTTAKRESIENRRDSSSVRQALASPAPGMTKLVGGDILADLDPNSPSPRKSQALAAAEIAGGKVAAVDGDEDELASNAVSPTKRAPAAAARKSGRVKKKAQVLPATTYNPSGTTTAGGPNRISIRGAGDSVVVLKKTEAQTLAQVTRSNTKKNKSGAVLPTQRLTRLAAEKLAKANDEIAPSEEGDEMDVDVDVPPTTVVRKSTRRAVKWAETLESFHEGANEPETSMLSDELNEGEVPASDTPSKPKVGKLRRLRTPRATASSSTTPAVAPEVKPEVKPRATKRSSRIATPAKLPGAAKSLLPDGIMDVEDGSASATVPTPAPATAGRKLAVSSTRKKAPSSKLPAPASSLVSGNKENSLIASPPKKRGGGASAAGKSIPKLDFKGKMEIDAPTGLGIGASPAKKGRPTQVLFKEGGEVSVQRPPELGLGMGSPAKKRVRRGL